jgi:hypothetical protein
LFLNLLPHRYVEQYEFYSGLADGKLFAGKGKRGIIKNPDKQNRCSEILIGDHLGGFNTTFDINVPVTCSMRIFAINTGITDVLNTRQIEMVGSRHLLVVHSIMVEGRYRCHIEKR